MAKTHTLSPTPETLSRAAQAIERGELVAFPTETVYGLGAKASDFRAVQAVFVAKGRPADNPLIVHIASFDQLVSLTRECPPVVEKLAQTFWPGPLTLVLKKSQIVLPQVAAGLDTVAIRIPNHPVALAFLQRCASPLVAPSANRSGRPSSTTAQHVLDDLGGRIPYILDGGATSIGLESSVVDLSQDPPLLLRLGQISLETLQEYLPTLQPVRPDHHDALRRSPGLRHRHYAPRARVVLVERGTAEQVALLPSYQGCKIGILSQRSISTLPESIILHGMPTNPEHYARDLFASLRTLDEQKVDVIFVEKVEEIGIGRAIMDRLRRAAS